MTRLVSLFGDKNYELRLVTEKGLFIGTSIPVERLVMAEQVHGDGIHICSATDGGAGFEGKAEISGADALITDIRGQFLMVRTADCCPVFIIDKKYRVVAAIHSGRDGTRKNIVGKAIRLIESKFGIKPQDLILETGPCICSAHYEVSRELYEGYIASLRKQGIEPACQHERKIDLRGDIRSQALQAGILKKQIKQDMACTFEEEALYSFRRDGNKNRQINFIGIIDEDDYPY